MLRLVGLVSRFTPPSDVRVTEFSSARQRIEHLVDHSDFRIWNGVLLTMPMINREKR